MLCVYSIILHICESLQIEKWCLVFFLFFFFYDVLNATLSSWISFGSYYSATLKVTGSLYIVCQSLYRAQIGYITICSQNLVLFPFIQLLFS